MAKKSKKKVSSFAKFLVLLLDIVMVINIVCVIKIGILPAKFFWPIIGVFFFLILLFDILLLQKKKKKTLLYLFSIILIGIFSLSAYHELNTLGFLNYFGKNNYKEEVFDVLVLNNSSYNELKDLDNKSIGYIKEFSKGQEKFIKKVKHSIDFESVYFDDSGTLIDDLLSGKVDSIIIEEAQYEMLKENMEDLENLVKIIYSKNINIKIKNNNSDVDVTKDSFNIYLSGIDTYGSVNKTSRSDVNLLLSVNPISHKILITSIPRDYYVSLRGKNGLKDKLTHAGIYGVETSMGTLEDLLDTKIDYFVKVNFSSVVRIVDTLGGIEVNSNYSFTSKDGYKYVKGINYLDGEQTLSFVRERYAFSGGDRVRGENQQIVLKALIEKCMSKKILTKYSSLLNNVKGNFITNIDDKEIKDLINKQLKDNSTWSIETYNLDGYNGNEYTYSYKTQKLYVMLPDENSVNTAKSKIKEINSKKDS